MRGTNECWFPTSGGQQDPSCLPQPRAEPALYGLTRYIASASVKRQVHSDLSEVVPCRLTVFYSLFSGALQAAKWVLEYTGIWYSSIPTSHIPIPCHSHSHTTKYRPLLRVEVQQNFSPKIEQLNISLNGFILTERVGRPTCD